VTDVDRIEDEFAEKLAAYWERVRAEDPSLPAITFEPFHEYERRELVPVVSRARIHCVNCRGEVGLPCPLCLGAGFVEP
jgi:hypothetical protein